MAVVEEKRNILNAMQLKEEWKTSLQARQKEVIIELEGPDLCRILSCFDGGNHYYLHKREASSTQISKEPKWPVLLYWFNWLHFYLGFIAS
ncbi:hypothetical protein GJAV_G00070390 [Gymnothorax javanicus]|nr:hypothetical protein GJAV_G00070390 [Gymnothorax javanicus]